MIKFKNGYSANIETEDEIVYITVFNPSGDMCDRRKYTDKDGAKIARFIRCYGED